MAYSEESIAKLSRNPLLNRGDELVCVDPSIITEIDILPAYADIDLGRMYDHIGFDDEAMIARMREEGMSDADIASHKFRFSANLKKVTADIYEQGKYAPDSKELILNPGNHIEDFMTSIPVVNANGKLSALNVLDIDSFDSISSQNLSLTAYHEIHHMKQAVVDGNLSERSEEYRHAVRKQRTKIGKIAALLTYFTYGAYANIRSFTSETADIYDYATNTSHSVAAAIGVLAVVSLTNMFRHDHEDYLANPVEIEAREAASGNIPQVVTVELKPEVLKRFC